MSILAIAAFLALAAWLWLVFLHAGFWKCDQRLPDAGIDGRDAPPVAVVIPARNEAESIGQTVSGLLAQDYPGEVSVILVDDSSTDGTADVALAAAAGDRRLSVIANTPLPAGWAGKMWAVNSGLSQLPPAARWVLLTDADIYHEPRLLRRLVAKAESDGRVMVSLMVKLNCETFWERLLIPAFVYFFQKLYPFTRVNDRRDRMAAAAGGCMLVRRDVLDRIGGVRRIRDAIIDDCALAREVKDCGPVWLGLAEETRSLRRYDRLGEIWDMVARTAYTQLSYSPLMLAGAVAGMGLLYVLPVFAMFWGLVTMDLPALVAGLGALLLMAASCQPVMRLYGLGPAHALSLPLAGLLYGMMTWSSGWRHWMGRGGGWKGRTYGAAGPSSGGRGEGA
jgi:hopene-associated glycosyltransferase HpnB